MPKIAVKFYFILLILFFLGCELIKPEEELKIGIPGDVKITQIDNESIKVSWSSVSKATSYEVALVKEGEDWSFKNTKETSFTFDSLSPGKYQAKVKAIINETKGDFSEVVDFNLTSGSSTSSNDATLSSLTLSNGSISFNSTTEVYNVNVANSVESITVAPTVNHSGATVKVDGITVASGSSSSSISLAAGFVEEINIIVTAEDGTTSKKYTVKVTREAPVVNGIDLVVKVDSVVIDGSQTKFTFTVKNQGNTNISGTTYFTVKLLPHSDESPTSDSSGRITSSFTAGSSSRNSNLDAGESITYTSTFTTESSYSGTYFGGTAYAIVNVYSDSNFTEADSSNNISSSFNWGNPAGDFTNSTISVIGEEDYYSFSVVSGEKYYFQGSNDDEDSQADINVEILKTDKTYIDSKDISVNTMLTWTADVTDTVYLKAFANSHTDRYRTGTYSIRVFSVSGGATLTAIADPFNTTNPASTDATLSSLTLSNGSISFNSSTEAYNANVNNSVDSITVTPTVSDSGATVTVEGSSVTSGFSSSAISLTVGVAHEINIIVTAEDGTTKKEYTVTVTRQAPVINGVDLVISINDIYQSGDQTYIDYSIKNQGDTDITGDDNYFFVKVGPDYETQPALDSSHYAESHYYYGSASIKKSTIKSGDSVTGTANFDIEDVGFGTFFGGDAYAWIEIASSSAFTDVDLTNNITGPISWGNDPGEWTDSNLSIIGEEDWYKMDVVNGTKYYIQGTEDIDQSFADIKVDLRKSSSNSIESKDIDHRTYIVWTSDITGTVYLKGFSDSFYDSYKTGNYSLRVFTKDGGVTITAIDDPFSTPVSTDATLSSLTLSNGSISFNSSTEAYSVNVDNSVDSITVTPTVSDSGATVTVEGSSVTSDTSSSAISLTAGVSKEINVIVTAEDGITIKEYTVTVTRAADEAAPELTVGTLTAGNEKWYAFDVTSNVEYTITTEDYLTDDAYTADVTIDVIRYTEIVDFIVERSDNSRDTFVASDSGAIYIRIAGYYSNSTGTYALNVKDASGTNIALTQTENKQAEWLESSITAGGEKWFSVQGYADELTYIFWYDVDSNNANIKVSAYSDSAGSNAYFEDENQAYDQAMRVTPTSNGTIYIKVTGYDSSEAGIYFLKVSNTLNEYPVITEL